MNENVEIAIIGGTGVYDPGLLKDTKHVKIFTPFGATSDLITIGNYNGTKIAFLARHGLSHHIPPHHIPAKANLWALNQLGVKRIISPCAVGSLRPEMVPGDIVIPDQFFDFTKGREYTFYDGGEVGHISMAEPFCPELRKLAIQASKEVGVKLHESGTTVTIQGPRYSSRAESIYFRDAVKAHIVGMTLIPECTLARELEICYVSIAAVTDYDAWSDEIVDTASVKKVMEKNAQTIRQLLLKLIPMIPKERNNCSCPHALENAMI